MKCSSIILGLGLTLVMGACKTAQQQSAPAESSLASTNATQAKKDGAHACTKPSDNKFSVKNSSLEPIPSLGPDQWTTSLIRVNYEVGYYAGSKKVLNKDAFNATRGNLVFFWPGNTQVVSDKADLPVDVYKSQDDLKRVFKITDAQLSQINLAVPDGTWFTMDGEREMETNFYGPNAEVSGGELSTGNLKNLFYRKSISSDDDQKSERNSLALKSDNLCEFWAKSIAEFFEEFSINTQRQTIVFAGEGMGAQLAVCVVAELIDNQQVNLGRENVGVITANLENSQGLGRSVDGYRLFWDTASQVLEASGVFFGYITDDENTFKNKEGELPIKVTRADQKKTGAVEELWRNVVLSSPFSKDESELRNRGFIRQ